MSSTSTQRISTIVGRLLANDGGYLQHSPGGQYHEAGLIDPARFGTRQLDDIALVRSHDDRQEVGEVAYLERSRSGSLWCVARTTLPALDHRRCFSGRFHGHQGVTPLHIVHTIIEHVSLVERSAAGGGEVVFLGGFDVVERGSGLPFGTADNVRSLIGRAHAHLAAERYSRTRAAMTIHDEPVAERAAAVTPALTHKRVRLSDRYDPAFDVDVIDPAWNGMTYEQHMLSGGQYRKRSA